MKSSLVSRPPDRRSWLWLAIGAALLPLSSFQPGLPLAAWLAPVFLLRFTRTRRAVVGLPLLAFVASVALYVNWSIGTSPAPLGISGAIAGLLYTLGYAVDRALAPRLTGFARTLVFPLAVTSVDWLGSVIAGLVAAMPLPSFFGIAATFASPAYTQFGNLPLLQLVSITGLWGVTFLMAWFAPVVGEVWEQQFDWRLTRSSTFGFTAAIALALVFGSTRLAFFAPAAPAVRVAGIIPREDISTTITDVSPRDLTPGTDALRARARSQFAPITDDLLARSEQEARNGAKIIVWPEVAAPVLQEDVSTLIERSGSLAHREGIYLQLGLVVFRHSDQFPFLENRAVLFDPTGAVIWDYHKAHPTPGENMIVASGPGIVPTVDTPYGRLATVICYDMDFPDLVRQAGMAGADILFAPSKDWPSVRMQHAQMAEYRAIENGVSVVRPVLSGVSTSLDPYGRILAQVDDVTSDTPTMVASVAARGTTTIYRYIGDSFAYLCVAGLLALAGAAVLRPRSHAAPIPQPA